MTTVDKFALGAARVALFAVPTAAVLLALIVHWFDTRGFWLFR